MIQTNEGPACGDKDDVIKECKRQLDNIDVYLKLSKDQMEMLTRQIQNQLANIIDFHKQQGKCSIREEFLLSKLNKFVMKEPIVGRPIISGCTWILTPGHSARTTC